MASTRHDTLAIEIKISDDIYKWNEAFDPAAFKKRLPRHFNRPMQRVLIFAVRVMRRVMRERRVIGPKKVALTRALQKKWRWTQLLIDRGELFRAVSWEMDSDKLGGRVGYWKGAENVTDSLYELAKLVIVGGYTPVSQKMRNLFYVLWKTRLQVSGVEPESKFTPATLSGRAAEMWALAPDFEWKPLKAGTTRIHYPPRDVVKPTLNAPELIARILSELSPALFRAVDPRKLRGIPQGVSAKMVYKRTGGSS